MYKFTDLNIQQSVDTVLPSVAMKFDGKVLENELEGYQTLTVSGRETISSELTSFNVKNGSITTNKRLPSRTLVVKYLLKERDNYTFQKKFKELRKLLHSDSEVEIAFADEPDAFYFGQLSEMGEVPADANFVTGTFSIYCDSPYKFGELTETAGAIPIDTFYETQPDLIQLTLSAATSVVKITNGSQTIQLNGNFSAGDLIELDIQNGLVKWNDIDSEYIVSLNSDFENFAIKNGQAISSPQGSLKITMRERWL